MSSSNPSGGGGFRNAILWGVVVVLAALLYTTFTVQQSQRLGNAPTAISYSEFLSDVRGGGIKTAVVQGERVTGTYKNGGNYTVIVGNDSNLPQQLAENGVDIKINPREEGGIVSLLLSWLPMFVLLGLWVFFMNRMQGGAGKAMGFGKSRARLLNENMSKVTFADVAGIDEAREELTEIVEFLRDPQKFQRLGGRIPKGALLIGSPGTGKTLLARAIAGEAGVPFFSISGSDFVEMFVGVGASRVRDMFEQAKKNAPCIIFIDEIDAVGRHRGAGVGGGNDEREQTLNQLLVEMDGFEANDGIILVAATNRPDVLDPALLRPGRFDRQIHVPNPDINGREAILNVHIRKVAVGNNVDVRTLARGTPGFAGAELANLVNEAALLAARRNKKLISMQEFEDAKDKVMMGAERRSMAMSEDEKKLTAYHEAGHALVGRFVPGNDPLHKVTIIPRGRALGLTMNLPERDRFSIKKREMEARLAMMFGGRVAEEMIFGTEDVTTGASNDILQATELARSMVMLYGMSAALGPLHYREQEEGYFSQGKNRTISNETQRLIDAEVRRLVEQGETKARQVLQQHVNHLHTIAQALLEYETLSGEEVDDLMEGRPLNRANAIVSRGNNDDTPSSQSVTPPPIVPIDTRGGGGLNPLPS